MDEDDLADYNMMTVRDLSELLHLPVNTIYYWRQKKMTSVWLSVFGATLTLPDGLTDQVLQLADIRSEFAHCKWESSQMHDDLELHYAAKDSIASAEEIVDMLSRLTETYVWRHSKLPAEEVPSRRHLTP